MSSCYDETTNKYKLKRIDVKTLITNARNVASKTGDTILALTGYIRPRLPYIDDVEVYNLLPTNFAFQDDTGIIKCVLNFKCSSPIFINEKVVLLKWSFIKYGKLRGGQFEIMYLEINMIKSVCHKMPSLLSDNTTYLTINNAHKLLKDYIKMMKSEPEINAATVDIEVNLFGEVVEVSQLMRSRPDQYVFFVWLKNVTTTTITTSGNNDNNAAASRTTATSSNTLSASGSKFASAKIRSKTANNDNNGDDDDDSTSKDELVLMCCSVNERTWCHSLIHADNSYSFSGLKISIISVKSEDYLVYIFTPRTSVTQLEVNSKSEQPLLKMADNIEILNKYRLAAKMTSTKTKSAASTNINPVIPTAGDDPRKLSLPKYKTPDLGKNFTLIGKVTNDAWTKFGIIEMGKNFLVYTHNVGVGNCEYVRDGCIVGVECVQKYLVDDNDDDNDDDCDDADYKDIIIISNNSSVSGSSSINEFRNSVNMDVDDSYNILEKRLKSRKSSISKTSENASRRNESEKRFTFDNAISYINISDEENDPSKSNKRTNNNTSDEKKNNNAKKTFFIGTSCTKITVLFYPPPPATASLCDMKFGQVEEQTQHRLISEIIDKSTSLNVPQVQLVLIATAIPKLQFSPSIIRHDCYKTYFNIFASKLFTECPGHVANDDYNADNNSNNNASNNNNNNFSNKIFSLSAPINYVGYNSCGSKFADFFIRNDKHTSDVVTTGSFTATTITNSATVIATNNNVIYPSLFTTATTHANNNVDNNATNNKIECKITLDLEKRQSFTFLTIETLLKLVTTDKDKFKSLDGTKNYWSCIGLSSLELDSKVYVAGLLQFEAENGNVILKDQTGSVECVITELSDGGSPESHHCFLSGNCKTDCYMTDSVVDQKPNCPYVNCNHRNCLIRVDRFCLIEEKFTIADVRSSNELIRCYLVFSAKDILSLGPLEFINYGLTLFPYIPSDKDVPKFDNVLDHVVSSHLTPYQMHINVNRLENNPGDHSRFLFQVLFMNDFLQDLQFKNRLVGNAVTMVESETRDKCTCVYEVMVLVEHKGEIMTEVAVVGIGSAKHQNVNNNNINVNRSNNNNKNNNFNAPDFDSMPFESTTDLQFSISAWFLKDEFKLCTKCCSDNDGISNLNINNNINNNINIKDINKILIKFSKNSLQWHASIHPGSVYIIQSTGVHAMKIKNQMQQVSNIDLISKSNSRKTNDVKKGFKYTLEIKEPFCTDWIRCYKNWQSYLTNVESDDDDNRNQNPDDYILHKKIDLILKEFIYKLVKCENVEISGADEISDRFVNLVGVVSSKKFIPHKIPFDKLIEYFKNNSNNNNQYNNNQNSINSGNNFNEDAELETMSEAYKDVKSNKVMVCYGKVLNEYVTVTASSTAVTTATTAAASTAAETCNTLTFQGLKTHQINGHFMKKTGIGVPEARNIVIELKIHQVDRPVRIFISDTYCLKYKLGLLTNSRVLFRNLKNCSDPLKKYWFFVFTSLSSVSVLDFPREFNLKVDSRSDDVDVCYLETLFEKFGYFNSAPSSTDDHKNDRRNEDDDNEDAPSMKNQKNSIQVDKKRSLLSIRKDVFKHLESSLGPKFEGHPYVERYYFRSLFYKKDISMHKSWNLYEATIDKVDKLELGFTCERHIDRNIFLPDKCPFCEETATFFQGIMAAEINDGTCKSFVNCHPNQVKNILGVTDQGWAELSRLVENCQNRRLHVVVRKGECNYDDDGDDDEKNDFAAHVCGVEKDLTIFLRRLLQSPIVTRRFIFSVQSYRTFIDQKGNKTYRVRYGPCPIDPISSSATTTTVAAKTAATTVTNDDDWLVNSINEYKTCKNKKYSKVVNKGSVNSTTANTTAAATTTAAALSSNTKNNSNPTITNIDLTEYSNRLLLYNMRLSYDNFNNNSNNHNNKQMSKPGERLNAASKELKNFINNKNTDPNSSKNDSFSGNEISLDFNDYFSDDHCADVPTSRPEGCKTKNDKFTTSTNLRHTRIQLEMGTIAERQRDLRKYCFEMINRIKRVPPYWSKTASSKISELRNVIINNDDDGDDGDDDCYDDGDNNNVDEANYNGDDDEYFDDNYDDEDFDDNYDDENDVCAVEIE